MDVDGWMDRWMDGWVDGWMEEICKDLYAEQLKGCNHIKKP